LQIMGTGTLATALAVLAAACAANTSGGTALAAGMPREETRVDPVTQPSAPRATLVAQRLAEAEAAFADGDRDRLVRVLAALDAGGVHPLDAAASAALAGWQQAAGGTATPFRGRLLGPAYVRGELGPGEVWRSSQTFISGETSTLSVSHQGEGPVRMQVSDGKARPICQPRKGAAGACRFTPLYTQRYNIELRNEGDARAVYFLVFD
jgi:hypothetical protein